MHADTCLPVILYAGRGVNSSDGLMSNPSIAMAESVFQVAVSAVRRNTFLTILLFTYLSSALTNKERVQD